MPVTAKLSRAFYDRFGDDIVAELVEWLNQVDAAYRSDLRDMIDANNLRIDARFEQLRAEVRADISESAASIRRELVESHASLRTDMNQGFAALSIQLAGVRADLMKWSFGFWVGAVLAIAALAGVLRLTG
jgi:hypothetical protein